VTPQKGAHFGNSGTKTATPFSVDPISFVGLAYPASPRD
jgi:hypothetical protein